MLLRSSLAAIILFASANAADAPKQVHFAACTQAGVEPGCVIARGGDGQVYNVTGAVPGLKPHDWLQGTASVGKRVSTCMQGQTITGFKRDANQASANCVGGPGH